MNLITDGVYTNRDCYVKVPKFRNCDVFSMGDLSTDQSWHPAFIVHGVVKDFIYVGKYEASVTSSKAYSKPGVAPTVNINYDNADAACTAKGTGFHLITTAEWAAVALWCKANGYQPAGNNSSSAAVNTGSGGNTYSTTNEASGIFDMNGNVWEWVRGQRTTDGKTIQLIGVNADGTANNDAADNTISMASSGPWVATGYAYSSAYNNSSFASCTVTGSGANNVTQNTLKTLALIPNSSNEDYGSDAIWSNGSGETLPLRGGDWYTGASSGVFALNLNNARSNSNNNVGFRAVLSHSQIFVTYWFAFQNGEEKGVCFRTATALRYTAGQAIRRVER